MYLDERGTLIYFQYRCNIANIIFFILLLYYNVKTMAKMDLH